MCTESGGGGGGVADYKLRDNGELEVTQLAVSATLVIQVSASTPIRLDHFRTDRGATRAATARAPLAGRPLQPERTPLPLQVSI